MSERPEVSIRARFDRSPTGVRGALILRGEDADPHVVRFRGVRAVAIDGADAREVAMPTPVLDVAPHRDLFVPFDLNTGDLGPGWYRFACDVEVDGTATELDGGKRFSVGWPRGTLRRGTVKVERAIALPAGEVRLEQIDCLTDTTRVVFGAASEMELPSAELHVDGAPLPLLDVEREASGRGRIVAYPIARTVTTLRIGFGGAGLEVGLEA